jgi:hypothetical protein
MISTPYSATSWQPMHPFVLPMHCYQPLDHMCNLIMLVWWPILLRWDMIIILMQNAASKKSCMDERACCTES